MIWPGLPNPSIHMEDPVTNPVKDARPDNDVLMEKGGGGTWIPLGMKICLILPLRRDQLGGSAPRGEEIEEGNEGRRRELIAGVGAMAK